MLLHTVWRVGGLTEHAGSDQFSRSTSAQRWS